MTISQNSTLFPERPSSTGRFVEAYDIFAPALDGFEPTRQMPEIAEAQALLAALSF